MKAVCPRCREYRLFNLQVIHPITGDETQSCSYCRTTVVVRAGIVIYPNEHRREESRRRLPLSEEVAEYRYDMRRMER